MATLYAGTEGPVRMDTADISTWLSGSVYDSSPTHMSISGSGGSYRIFGGTGFTFGPSGIFASGTVNPTGGQDVLDLDSMFDALGIGAVGRSGRVQLTDKGASVEVKIDTNGDGTFEYLAATIQSASPITVGDDVLVGS